MHQYRSLLGTIVALVILLVSVVLSFVLAGFTAEILLKNFVAPDALVEITHNLAELNGKIAQTVAIPDLVSLTIEKYLNLLNKVWLGWGVFVAGVSLTVVFLLFTTVGRQLHRSEVKLSLLRRQLKDESIALEKALKDKAETRQQMAAMHERISDCFLLISPANNLTYMNNAAKVFLRANGFPEVSTPQPHIQEVFPGIMQDGLEDALYDVRNTRQPKLMELCLRKQGVWVELRLFSAAAGITAYFRDITGDKKREGRVSASLSLLRQLMDASPDTVALVSTDWSYILASRSWTRSFRLEGQIVEGISHKKIVPDFLKNIENADQRLQAGEEISVDEEPHEVAHREEWIRWHVSPWYDDTNRLAGYIIHATFTTEVRKQRRVQDQEREKERKLAYHDLLTGLPNRQMFYERLNDALTQAYRQLGRVAVMFLDLDGFKAVNDKLGHDIGDMLLKEVANRLNLTVRKYDTVARLGGDEFTVILTNIKSAADVAVVAQKVIDVIAPDYVFGDKIAKVTTSIGIALYPSDGSSAVEIIKHADMAMYRAKELGKNNYQFFVPEDRVNLQDSANKQSFIKAMGAGEFALYYQPQYDLKTQQIIGVEALLRWHHPKLGLLEPGKFLKEVEAAGVMVDLGNWTIHEACKQMQKHIGEGGKPMRVSVNLAQIQFNDGGLINTVRDALSATSLPPELLSFDLSEHVVLKPSKTTKQILNELKGMGVKLYIDDFGTGVSSMNTLKEYPIDGLKIHQSFLHKVLSEPEARAIVKAIITLGQNMNLDIMAEGVESTEQVDFLLSSGCSRLQGFLFGRPVKPSKAFDFTPQA